jgi:excinuclease ABC subunit B
LEQIRVETEKGGRVLVTTLTKKLSEDLTRYLGEIGVKAKYLHSDIETLERVQIINQLRKGVFDVLVGVNLLREGLDIPEVSLVCILDADKEGFLRSETALIQTCGRAARHVDGHVIMYADKLTHSIQKALEVTQERRAVQMLHNAQHQIVPRSVRREMIADLAETFGPATEDSAPLLEEDLDENIRLAEEEMHKAAKEWRFEDAARHRDALHRYQQARLL